MNILWIIEMTFELAFYVISYQNDFYAFTFALNLRFQLIIFPAQQILINYDN